MNSDPAELFVRLAPVLNVRDHHAERAFSEKLGIPVIYEGEEYPDCVAFGTSSIHFGIQTGPGDNDPPSVLTWQIAVRDIATAMETCRDAGIEYEVENNDPLPGGVIVACSSRLPVAIAWHSRAPMSKGGP